MCVLLGLYHNDQPRRKMNMMRDIGRSKMIRGGDAGPRRRCGDPRRRQEAAGRGWRRRAKHRRPPLPPSPRCPSLARAKKAPPPNTSMRLLSFPCSLSYSDRFPLGRHKRWRRMPPLDPPLYLFPGANPSFPHGFSPTH